MYESDSNGNLQTTAEEIITIACQINANCFALYDPAASTLAEIGASLLPLSGMLNHSCSPNCIPITDALGQSVIRTVKNVSEGDELTISYVDLYLPHTDRREKLLGTKSFWCQCQRCLDPVSDFSVDGIRCTGCADGYFMPPLSEGDFESKSDTVYQCSLCSASLSKSDFEEIQKKSGQDFEAALDFAKIRNFEAAKRALESFRARSKETLHPNHHHLFNSLPPLINACIKIQEYGLAIQYAKDTIALMDSAPFVPANWPEKADYWFRLGELLEIYGMALNEGLVESAINQDGKKEWREYLKESLKAYQMCSQIRTVAFGREHPIARLAQEQEIRLGLACTEMA
jgi:hypothetical protein